MVTKKAVRSVVVCTQSRPWTVVQGEFVRQKEDTVVLENARMAVYWSAPTKGLLGLATVGPQEGSRITAPCPRIELHAVEAVLDCTEEATTAWKSEPWT